MGPSITIQPGSAHPDPAHPDLAHPDLAPSQRAEPYPVATSAGSRSSWTLLPSAAEQLRITGYDHESGTVVAVAGELDVASGPLLAEHLAKLASDLRARIVLDLTHLDFCDCTGLSVLLRAHRRFVENGGWLRLSAPRPTIHKTLRITRLARVLVCYQSIAEAFDDPPAAWPRPSPGGAHD